MYGSVSWSVILTGSERENIRKLVQDMIPLPCRTMGRFEEISNLQGIIVVVLCPGDNQELERMFREMNSQLRSSGVLPVAVLSFPSDSRATFPVCLYRNELSFNVLAGIVCSNGICAGKAENLNLISWEKTGSLLPFYIHNMNNILAKIMGNIELAEFQSSQPDKVKEKLAIALEGTEDLRSYIEIISDYSLTHDDESEWSSGNETVILEQNNMSCGTSVEFSYKEESGLPRKLPFRKSLMNIITSTIAASAIISVNGSGSVDMVASPGFKSVEFKVTWNSLAKNAGIYTEKLDSAADLLTRAIFLAFHAGMSFRLNKWDNENGSASLLVPVSEGAL